MRNPGCSMARRWQALRRRGVIRRHSARSAEIWRNRHLLWLKGRNSVPLDSVADCVAISSRNPENTGCGRIRHPAGSAAKRRDIGEFHPICRNSAKSPLNWDGRAEYRTPCVFGRIRRIICIGVLEISDVRGSAIRPVLRRGARFMGVPPDWLEFSEIATYLVWNVVIAHIAIMLSYV